MVFIGPSYSVFRGAKREARSLPIFQKRLDKILNPFMIDIYSDSLFIFFLLKRGSYVHSDLSRACL